MASTSSGSSKGGKAPIIKQGQTSGSFGNDPAVKEVNRPATPYKE